MQQDHYFVLGLTADASPEEIRKAYYDLVRRFHPDTSGQSGTTEQFLKIQAAYEVLSNTRQRAEYDAKNHPAAHQPPAVHIQVRASREYISTIHEPQVLYTLLDMTPTGEFNPELIPPIHVCLVIDRSTSMKGDRLEMVKTNIAQAMTLLKPADMISVVAFSDRAEVIIPPTRMGLLARGDARISSIQTSGATEILSGLNLGINLLQNGSEPLADRHLFLLTDGHTYGDEQACIELADSAGKQGITISTFGMGDEWQDQFLDHLTAVSGGNAVFVRASADLSRFLQEKIKEAGQAYARSLSLEIQLHERAKMVYAFRIKPNISPLPMETPIPLGSLLYGKPVTLLLEFRIEPLNETQQDFELFRGYVHLEIFDPAPRVARIPVKHQCSVKSVNKNTDVHPAVLDALSRLNLYRMQEQAVAAAESGDYQTAVRRMKNLSTQLLSRGENELAHAVLMEVEHLTHDHACTREGSKHIKYGTRSLLLPVIPEMDR